MFDKFLRVVHNYVYWIFVLLGVTSIIMQGVGYYYDDHYFNVVNHIAVSFGMLAVGTSIGRALLQSRKPEEGKINGTATE